MEPGDGSENRGAAASAALHMSTVEDEQGPLVGGPEVGDIYSVGTDFCFRKPDLRRLDEEVDELTQPTSGGAVTANSSCCANCVEPPRPQQWGSDLPFLGHVGHADPLDGWRCCSQKRVMSRPIQVRQL